MSNPKKPTKPVNATRKKTSRLMGKRLGILAGVSVLLIGTIFGVKLLSSGNMRASALEQSKESYRNNEPDLALRHLDRYLADHPEDITVLEAKAELLSKGATNADKVLQAAHAFDLLIRLDPNGEDRVATRRRLIELYITYGELVRNFADNLNDGQIEAHESRYLAAVQAAEELIHYKDPKTGIENGTIDPAAHRLKAMAYMGQVPGLIVKNPDDSVALGEAKKELDIALAMDPSEFLASEKLAELYLIHLKDPINAEKTLDQMIEGFKTKKFASKEEEDQAALKIRLSRFRAFYRSKNFEMAQKELEIALQFAPKNVELRVSAAGLALQRNDTQECRRQLDAIPPELQQENLRVRFLRGALEFAERHPEEAIDQWRKGLSLVGGGDVDLTWRLASNLIQFNRLVEARPLVNQYHRLSKPNDPLGMYLEGMYLEKSGHINRAIELMSKASTQVPSSFKSDTLMSLGHCYELIGDENKALYVYRQAANLGGSATGPRRAMARLYQNSNPARAIEELEIALSASKANGNLKINGQAKGDPNLLIDLIRVKLDRQMKLAKGDRNFSEIKQLVDEAKEVAPENPALQGLIAQYQSLENRIEDAVKTLEDTVKGSNRKRVESWLAWAEALETLGRLTDAIDVLDKGSATDAAGDHAGLRTAKARLLLKTGNGSQARVVLTTNIENIPLAERPELTKSLGDLLQELGDRKGAREAYIEWTRLAPESPFPALKLLSIAQLDGDDEASRAGLDALVKLGRENEPYALAAAALQLLRTDPAIPGPPPLERLNEADRKIEALNRIAPDFPVKFMIQGMILESRADPKDPKQWRESLTKAGEAYRKSIKIGTSSPALPKLIEIYMRLKDNDKLNLLKVEYDDGTQRQKTEIAMEFDRLSTLIALKLGDRDRAEHYLTEMSEKRPDNREIQFAKARMSELIGKLQEAEATYLELVKAKPNDPDTWLQLIEFQANRRSPAEVAKTIDQLRLAYKGDRPQLVLARCLARGKDLPNATRAFQKAVDESPDDLVTLRYLVEFRDATNQADQVEPILRKILKLDPTATWASRSLSLLLSARPDPSAWSEAWSLIAPGSSSSGDTPEDRLIRATILARSPESARRDEAIPAFIALANDLPLSNPIGIEARTRLSQAMLEINRPAEAWHYISPLSDDLTRSNLVSMAIAIEALARIGQGDEAEKRLNRLVASVPDSIQVVFSRAWVFHAQSKKDQAASTLLTAFEKVEKLPQGEAIGNSCLDLLMKFQNLDSANVLARKMVGLWPKEIKNLAKVQVARQEYDEALISCRTAIDQGSPREAIQYATVAAIARRSDKNFVKKVGEIGDLARNKAPNDYNILVYLATVRHLQDQYEQELAFYRMALEQKPPTRQFLNNMAWTLSEGLNKPDEGLLRIEELIKRDGPASEFLDTRGVIQTRLKNYEKAIEDLEKSVQGDPAALTYFHLARAYLRAKNQPEWRRCRDIAVSKKFDTASLDPTDLADVEEVMGHR